MPNARVAAAAIGLPGNIRVIPRRRPHPSHGRPLRERIERAMLTLAIIIENDGEVYAPIFERLEQELAALDRRESTIERAKQLAHASRSAPASHTNKVGEV